MNVQEATVPIPQGTFSPTQNQHRQDDEVEIIVDLNVQHKNEPWVCSWCPHQARNFNEMVQHTQKHEIECNCGNFVCANLINEHKLTCSAYTTNTVPIGRVEPLSVPQMMSIPVSNPSMATTTTETQCDQCRQEKITFTCTFFSF